MLSIHLFDAFERAPVHTHTHINCCPVYWWVFIPQLWDAKNQMSLTEFVLHSFMMLFCGWKRKEISGEKRKRGREWWSLKTILVFSLHTSLCMCVQFSQITMHPPKIPSALLLSSSIRQKISKLKRAQKELLLSHMAIDIKFVFVLLWNCFKIVFENLYLKYKFDSFNSF